uniref:CHAD domain-containing protein n=1 Tax=Anopheles atroparvus TaxID=41427 RepID=A0A182IQ84_ANOAO
MTAILRQMTTAARADWLRIRRNIRQRQSRLRNHVNAHGPVHQAKERKLEAMLKLHEATTAAERASATAELEAAEVELRSVRRGRRSARQRADRDRARHGRD